MLRSLGLALTLPFLVLGAGACSTPDATQPGAVDGSAGDAPVDAYCPPYVDEAGVTHGCGNGGQGPGDHDDGGGLEAGLPDVSQDASNLPFGSPCWDNAQCQSEVCFDFASKGQFCTQPCSATMACPPESQGCNGMGFCRVSGSQ